MNRARTQSSGRAMHGTRSDPHYSRIGGASSRATSTKRVGILGSPTRGRSLGMRGRTGSWRDCRERSSTSTGGRRSDGGTSPALTNSKDPLQGSCGSTTRSDRIKGTGPRDAPRRRCSGERPLTRQTRRPNVSTALRYWTVEEFAFCAVKLAGISPPRVRSPWPEWQGRPRSFSHQLV